MIGNVACLQLVNLYVTQPCLLTLMQTTLAQSERAYYLSYFITKTKAQVPSSIDAWSAVLICNICQRVLQRSGGYLLRKYTILILREKNFHEFLKYEKNIAYNRFVKISENYAFFSESCELYSQSRNMRYRICALFRSPCKWSNGDLIPWSWVQISPRSVVLEWAISMTRANI